MHASNHTGADLKVSVVVPVYNPGPYIEPLIESLLAQTLPSTEFEAIFVDDGSTDEAPRRLDEVAAAHPHLRVIHQPNSGWPGKPRNVGMDAARGEFVHFVDHDDYLAPDALARLYDRAISTGADIVLGKVVSVHRKTPMDVFWERRDQATLATDPLESTLTPHKLFRMSMLRDANIRYPEGKVRLEDNLFVLKAYFAAMNVAVLADSPCYYFVKRSDDGNHSFERYDPVGYYNNLREVLDVVDANTEPGELRDRILRHFYLGKMLGRLREPKVLRFPDDYRAALFAEIRGLAGERFPDSVPDGLARVDRLRSVLLREGRLPELVTLAERCDPVRPWTAVQPVTWCGHELCIDFEVRLGFADGSPLLFPATSDGFRLDPRLTAGMDDAETVFSAEQLVDEASLRLVVHNPKSQVAWKVPCSVSVELAPPDGADGDAAGRTVRFVCRARIDPATAACGAALEPGSWVLRATASLCGLRRSAPLGPVPQPVPATRILASPGRLAQARLTDSDNVTLSIQRGDQMNRHDFLSAVHELLAPRSYVEIGVNTGKGLARARTRTIGVDPAFQIDRELQCDLQLVRATSDDFYARSDALAHFPDGVVDLTFIDGMHQFEFALRDFINAERTSTPAGAIIFDDMLPRSAPEAARIRHTKTWAGDVFWMIPVLERYRPDLTVLPLDTKPTGLLLVLGLDPANTVLREHYDEIVAEYVKDDPQQLPHEIEHRSTAADPGKVLASPVWTDLVTARASGGGTPDSAAELRALRGSASYVSNPPDPGVWPPKPNAATKPKPKKPATTGSPLARKAKHVLAVAKDPVRRRAAAHRLARESGTLLGELGLARGGGNVPAELTGRPNPLEQYFRSNDDRLVHKWLHYFDIYDRHFAAFRNRPITVVEFGVSHGGSLQMWKKYFGPRARIVGVDINPACADFTEPQIEVVIGDQGDREFLRGLREKVGKVDVLIEDGGHTMDQQIATFEEFWPAIRDGGVFLMEDLHTSYWRSHGGAYKDPGTFIEYAKRLIDQQHAWHARETDELTVDKYTRSIRGMHVYDSIIVFDKAKVTRPRHERTGKPSF